jgi:DNA repair exonuclease SbcCD nuclease subunit
MAAVRLVLFADLHLDTPFRWAPPEVARRRRQALRDTLDAIIDLAAEIEADALCCGGDLYEHDRVAPDTAAVIREAFARLAPMPVLVAPGNHDWLGPRSIYACTEWSPNVHIFAEDRLQPYELTAGLTVWGAAHMRPAGTAGFLDRFELDGARDDVHLALFHGTLRSGLPFEEEGKQSHAPFDAEQVPAAGLHHALVGHFHTPADGEWHTYPGNPDPLTFGETGERGAVVLEVQESGGVSRERHTVARTEVSDLVVDVTGCVSRQEVRSRTEATLEDMSGIVRVTLEGEVEPDVDMNLADLEGVAPHLAALVPRLGRITVAYDLDTIAEETTVRGRFVQDVRSAGLDPDMERRVLITGLRALEGRQDLEVA